MYIHIHYLHCLPIGCLYANDNVKYKFKEHLSLLNIPRRETLSAAFPITSKTVNRENRLSAHFVFVCLFGNTNFKLN